MVGGGTKYFCCDNSNALSFQRLTGSICGSHTLLWQELQLWLCLSYSGRGLHHLARCLCSCIQSRARQKLKCIKERGEGESIKILKGSRWINLRLDPRHCTRLENKSMYYIFLNGGSSSHSVWLLWCVCGLKRKAGRWPAVRAGVCAIYYLTSVSLTNKIDQNWVTHALVCTHLTSLSPLEACRG